MEVGFEMIAAGTLNRRMSPRLPSDSTVLEDSDAFKEMLFALGKHAAGFFEWI